jgi:hypothetical protein
MNNKKLSTAITRREVLKIGGGAIVEAATVFSGVGTFTTGQ